MLCLCMLYLRFAVWLFVVCDGLVLAAFVLFLFRGRLFVCWFCLVVGVVLLGG